MIQVLYPIPHDSCRVPSHKARPSLQKAPRIHSSHSFKTCSIFNSWGFWFSFFPALQLQILGVAVEVSTRRKPAEPWPSTSYQLLWEVWFGTAVFFSAQLCEQETSKNMFIPYISASMCCIQSKGKAPCPVWRWSWSEDPKWPHHAHTSWRQEIHRKFWEGVIKNYQDIHWPVALIDHLCHSSPRTCKDVELWNDMTC